MAPTRPLTVERASADAQQLGVSIDLGQAQQLLSHLSLLARWNATYNLTAVHGEDAMWRQHTMDCLAAVPSLQRALADLPGRPQVLDVGSGGGLPGVVWAIALPGVEVTCIDAVGKKAAFVRQAAGHLSVPNLTARHGRVEQQRGERYDVIASRAFASLADFTRWTAHLLKPGGRWLALKGVDPATERAELPPGVELFHVEPLIVPGLGAERCLVWMRPVTPDPPPNP